ncbi:hypothetical protein LWI28_026772 [Acer negundo]|uniref:RNase H type-1 domain-containing protein n=1 Tax=Acer negundo TaxID=4023 RepID=A0AAD5IKL4_ACENE|nr:hypothetical protein LWI28_026772 [Acer negundo]
MDSELEQLQSLGFFGTIKESFKILFPWKKIFTYITLTLILPLSILYLVQIAISDLISSKLTFYLLSTAAIIYTIACIYTAKQTTYKKVISVVPIAWKKSLLVTYRCSVPIALIYKIVAIRILAFWAHFIVNTVVGIVVGVWILILYVMGIVYISVIWQLACVVSVLEDKYGLKPMIKSRELIKGKMGVRTIIYFVCKSYHTENIDKSSLSDHLEEYLGDYVKLNRNCRGRVMACGAQSSEANYGVECAKAMAVYKGIIYCREIGVEKYVVETDSESVIKQIVKGDSSDQAMVSNSRNVSFQCVSAKANRVAWVLANEALDITDRVVWKDDEPICIKAMVEDDQRINFVLALLLPCVLSLFWHVFLFFCHFFCCQCSLV